jgi:FtsH-binding integral membrane protein
LTLIVQFAITFSIVYKFRKNEKLSKVTQQSFWTYLFVSLGLIIILSVVKMPIWLKFVIFSIYAVVNGALLHNASKYIPEQLISDGLKTTIGIFAVMTITAYILTILGINLGFLGMILLAALIGLLVASLLHTIVDTDKKNSILYQTLRAFGIVLFSVYIVFFTNMILQKNYNDDFVSAAIDLYLSFVNLFTRMLDSQ